MVCGEEKEINFEENIKLMGINSEDNANVTMEVLSSSIKPVDGKNYIYKIQLKAYIIVEKIEDLDIATAIDTDSQGENYENNFAKENSGKNNVEDIMTKKRNIDSLAIIAVSYTHLDVYKRQKLQNVIACKTAWITLM